MRSRRRGRARALSRGLGPSSSATILAAAPRRLRSRSRAPCGRPPAGFQKAAFAPTAQERQIGILAAPRLMEGPYVKWVIPRNFPPEPGRGSSATRRPPGASGNGRGSGSQAESTGGGAGSPRTQEVLPWMRQRTWQVHGFRPRPRSAVTHCVDLRKADRGRIPGEEDRFPQASRLGGCGRSSCGRSVSPGSVEAARGSSSDASTVGPTRHAIGAWVSQSSFFLFRSKSFARLRRI